MQPLYSSFLLKLLIASPDHRISPHLYHCSFLLLFFPLCSARSKRNWRPTNFQCLFAHEDGRNTFYRYFRWPGCLRLSPLSRSLFQFQLYQLVFPGSRSFSSDFRFLLDYHDYWFWSKLRKEGKVNYLQMLKKKETFLKESVDYKTDKSGGMLNSWWASWAEGSCKVLTGKNSKLFFGTGPYSKIRAKNRQIFIFTTFSHYFCQIILLFGYFIRTCKLIINSCTLKAGRKIYTFYCLQTWPMSTVSPTGVQHTAIPTVHLWLSSTQGAINLEDLFCL